VFLEFGHPWALLLLALVPLVAWRWRRRPRAALRYSRVAGLEALPPGRSQVAQSGGLWLRLGGLTLLILALAAPRWPDEGSRIPTEGISLAFVVDVSSSMAQRDFALADGVLNRLEGVQRVFRLLVEGGTGPEATPFPGRPQDLMMLVTFATRPETACPLTLDHAALLKILDAQAPRSVITEATTNPGDALAWALYGLQQAPTRRKVVILLTDGEANVPPPALKPLQAGQLAGNLGIPIYTIDAAPGGAAPGGAVDGGKAEGDAKQARATLENLAKMTQGRYFHATDGPALTEALSRIDRLERDLIESHRYRRYAEAYPWLALAALPCWLVILALEATWWRRAP
jgi:Ca-activated chloride channel family protein